MGINEVIKKGEEITGDFINPFVNMDIFTMLFLIVGIIVIIVTLIFCKKADVMVGGIVISVSIFLGVSIHVVTSGHSNELLQEIEDIDSWVAKEVEPFIENLPYEKIELESVKLNTKSKNKTGGYKGFDTWTDVSLIVEYEENGKRVKDTDKFDVIGIGKGKPYMKYKDVKKDLGHGIDKGKYDKVIYAPKDEIKKWWRLEE